MGGLDTMARGLLMLRLIPTTMVATMAMDVVFMATMDKSIYPYFIPIRLQTHTFSESTAATMSAQKEEFILLVGTPSAASFSAVLVQSLEMASRKQRIYLLKSC